MAKESAEAIKKQIEYHKAKHEKLVADIEAQERLLRPDGEVLRRMKKLKLMQKDKISELQDKLAELEKPKQTATVLKLPAKPVSAAADMRQVA